MFSDLLGHLQEIVTILNTLKQHAKITEAVLRVSVALYLETKSLTFSRIPQESKAGLAVGKLRSHAAKQVSELAKEIVKKWKTEVEREKAAAGGGAKATAKPPGAFEVSHLLTVDKRSSVLAAKKAGSSSAAATPSTPVTPTVSSGGSKASDSRSAKSDGVKIEYSGDKTRDKCAELIYDALVFDSGARMSLPLSLYDEPPNISQRAN